MVERFSYNYLGGPSAPTRAGRLVPRQHVQDVVRGVGREGVPASVHTNGGAPRDGHLELDVGGFRLIKLHVPVTVGRDGLLQVLSQLHHLEGGAVRRDSLLGALLVLCNVRSIWFIFTELSRLVLS